MDIKISQELAKKLDAIAAMAEKTPLQLITEMIEEKLIDDYCRIEDGAFAPIEAEIHKTNEKGENYNYCKGYILDSKINYIGEPVYKIYGWGKQCYCSIKNATPLEETE